jgi:hypothetical protein
LTPLIDCDVLRYEIGSCGQYIDEESGEQRIRSFDFVSELFDQRVEEICREVGATEPPLLFLTADPKLVKIVNRLRKLEGRDAIEYKPNFRDAIAVTKPYKGNRKNVEKPYHFDNLTAYICSLPGLRVAVGQEADDLMSMYQCSGEKPTIICSRDKDLKMVPGMHFSWECGKQPSWGPIEVSEMGRIILTEGAQPKIKGTGLKFFYSQLLTGDTVDNIPGCPGVGPKKAIVLQDCATEDELFEVVSEWYQKKVGEKWEMVMLEQGRLLWMKRSKNDVWSFPRPKD